MTIIKGILGIVAFFCIMLSVVIATIFTCIFIIPIYAIMRGLDEYHR